MVGLRNWFRNGLVVLCSVLCLLLWGLGTGAASAAASGGKWVVQIYFCGSNLESQHGSVTNDMAELTAALPSDNVTFLLETGGTTKWQNDVFKTGEIGRYAYTKDGLKLLQELPDADMGKGRTLSDFVKFGQDHFPADHRVLIIWNHGGGTVFGACQDERTGSIMSLNDMQDALAAVYPKDTAKPPLDLIGFDACLMSSYGTAGTFEGYAKYLVASQELEPGNGWNYAGIVQGFKDGFGDDPAELGKIICDTYLKGCKDVGTDGMAILAVTNLAKMPQLREAYENMGAEAIEAVQKDPQAFFTAYARAAEKSTNYGGNTKNSGYTDMIDLGNFAENTQKLLPESYADLQAALNNAVIYQVGGKYVGNACGLSCYYPILANPDLQQKFESVRGGAQSYKTLYKYFVTGGALPNVPKLAFDIHSMEDLAMDVDAEGSLYTRLNQRQMDNLSAIRCQVVYYDQDILMMLGSDANVDMDWDTGLCKDNFDGTWPMLDGHPIYIEVMNETEKQITYFVPLKVNGKETNMIVVYDGETQDYKILGTRHELTDGMGDKNLEPLKPGDTVTTQLLAMDVQSDSDDLLRVDGDTFTLPDGFRVADDNVGDGKYGYMFEFVTPKGDTALSQVASFSIKDGKITTSNEMQ